MRKILDYLEEKYAPEAIILYGSYADGTQNGDSDFDALVLTEKGEYFHDTSVVEGICLDVFVYPGTADIAPADYPQLSHGKIILDKTGRGKALIEAVQVWIAAQPKKTAAQINESLTWCRKMLGRAKRNDAEGLYRRHWLLCDSLEIYCDIAGQYFFGPKKALLWMEKNDRAAFAVYQEALASMDTEKLEQWIDFLARKSAVDRL